MRLVFLLFLALPLCSGCFVLEELDKGAEIMDQHASQERREAEARKKVAEKQGEENGESLVADLKGHVASLGGWLEEATEKAPPQRDPTDTVVRCQIAGKTHYLRKSDCRVRGGREG